MWMTSSWVFYTLMYRGDLDYSQLSKDDLVQMLSVVYHDFEKQKDELVGKKEFGAWYTHIRKIHYEMYDTYQVIDYSKDSSFWNKRKEDDENAYFMEYKKYLKES